MDAINGSGRKKKYEMRHTAATTARILNQRMSRTMKANRYNTFAACIKRSTGNAIVRPLCPSILPLTGRSRHRGCPPDSLCGHRGASGKFPARPQEVAGVAIRVALEVILVLWLGLPELAHRGDCRHRATRPQTRGVDIVDCPQSLLALRLGDVKDLRAVRSSDIVALAIQRGWIVNLEEDLQNVTIADTCRVELDLYGLGVRSMVSIRRV